MKKENEERRGKLLLKERKMSDRKIAVLTIFIFTTYVVITYLTLCPEHCYMFLPMLLIPVLFVPMLLARSYPFTVYENGFDMPLDLLRVIRGEKRFIPFRDIKKIWPYYSHGSLSDIRVSGYVIETVDGRKLGLIDSMNGPELYEAGLKLGMGKKFEMLYDPEPPGILRILEDVRKCISKRKEWVVLVAYVASALMIPFFVFMPILQNHIFIFMMFFAVALIGVGFAPLIIMKDAICIKNYYFLKRFKPDVAESIISESGIIPYFEKARRFEKKDWKKIQNIMFLNPFIPIAAGVAMFALSMSNLISEKLAYYLLFTGLATMSLAVPLILVIESKVAFLRIIIEGEKRTGEKIIPYDFRIPNWIESFLPYRKAPEFSENKWKRIADNALPMDEESLVLRVILITALLLLGFIVPVLLSHLGYHGLLNVSILLVLAILPPIWFRLNLNLRNMARNVLIYEKETGEKVIPDRYRKKIESAFLGVYHR